MHQEIRVLDHGYVRLVEDWGRGDAGVPEAGMVEAARQSTQASFRGWEDAPCPRCRGEKIVPVDPGGVGRVSVTETCPDCRGKGYSRPGDARLLRYLWTSKPKHATPFEFAGMVVEVQAPIFVFREWHRHRTQSYNEMSARYAPVPDLNYLPTPDRCLMGGGDNRQAGSLAGSEALTEDTARAWLGDLSRVYGELEALYQRGLGLGVPKELARLLLPMGRYSRMRASANLRNWLAFVTLRADPKAQWEIRQYALAVGQILGERFPLTWSLFQKGRTT